jgi:hypothetical protein
MRQDKGQVRHRHARLDLNNPPTAVGGIQVTSRWVCRLDLNNPPTAVGGIQVTSRRVCRLDLNNPPTAVGGISVRLTMVRLNLAHMDGNRWTVQAQPNWTSTRSFNPPMEIGGSFKSSLQPLQAGRA